MKKILELIKLQYYMSCIIFLYLFGGTSARNYWTISSFKIKLKKTISWYNIME